MTCMHGQREGLDSHDCPACFAIATESGADVTEGKTYIYTKDPRVPAKLGVNDVA